MVLIAVNNFQYRDSLGVYELPEGSLIIDLKAEIEATEGISIGHQRLLREENSVQDFKDNENLDSLISDGSSKVIIYLVQARIFYHVERRIGDAVECEPSYFGSERSRGIPTDLEKPIRACDLVWRQLRRRYDLIDPSIANISVLGSDERPAIGIPDLDQSFSYYGVCNGDTIHVVYHVSRQSDQPYPPSILHGSSVVSLPSLPPIRQHLPELSISPKRRVPSPGIHKCTIVRAKYDWNGEIMHPNIKGLSLKHTALFTVFRLGVWRIIKIHESPGWLYGSPVSASEVDSFQRGYFPENFVSPVDETNEQHLDVTSTEILDIPPLPPFHFPPAHRMTFRMPIADKGHSFLKFTANYEYISSPVDPTHVTILLLCTTHDIRRISAVSVFITIPESTLLDVQVCENEAHQKEIHTDKEVTETQSKGKHFDGINIGTHGTTVGLQGGVSRGYSLGGTEKGQKVSRRKVTAAIDNEDTICWNLKAPTSKLDEDGLDGKESITLVLKKKPVEFKYKCRVTHGRDGVEKTTQRITDNKPWDFFLFK